MTTRDRLALIGISTLAVLGVVWLLFVSPERKKASELSAQITQANAQLSSAEGEVTSARSAQGRYSAAYASVVNLGKAVPPSEEVPALIYQLAQASNQKHVELSSIATGAGATGAAGAGAASAATPTATPGATQAFTQMPFTFVFNGSFNDLYHLFHQLDAATARKASGGLHVSGRLLTVQGMKLEPQAQEGGGQLTGTITATAYVLPSSSGLTGGSTATAPAPGAASTTSSSAPAGSSSAPPAVVTAGAPR
jgi:hypothetical protein